MKSSFIKISSCCLFLFCCFAINGQTSIDPLKVYKAETYKKGNNTLNYRLLLPPNFSGEKKYPLVVFLHGMGERGDDNKKQLTHGSKLWIENAEEFPAIVLFPQCPVTDYWANLSRPDKGGSSRVFTFNTDQGPNPSLAMVVALMDEMIAKSYVDEERVYVGGLSMGGMGVFELLWRIPEKIAAAFPICGGGPPEKAAAMKAVPMWIFHGVDDSVVHPRYSMRMLRAVQGVGGTAKISLYPNVDHNSWDHAFAEPTLLPWLFSKKLK